jgi:hypothetical protein
MDKRQQYRQLIHQILIENAEPYTHSEDVEPEVICDIQNDHYQLTYVGWNGQKRVFGVILHFDIKDDKIWIQYNGTELSIATILKERGVPASDIVLGFHSPLKRPYSGYAIA